MSPEGLIRRWPFDANFYATDLDYGTPLLWFSLMKMASGLIVRVPVNLDHGVMFNGYYFLRLQLARAVDIALFGALRIGKSIV